MAADWHRIKALFEQALALAPETRRAFLIGATSDDALRAEVASLLAHAEVADDALSRPAQLDTCPASDVPAPSREGQRLGAWTVTGLLGRGGMGEVLRARRADGAYEGDAAIKLLRPGMDTQALSARFALERRALARLNHPHIARLFDAGVTSDDVR